MMSSMQGQGRFGQSFQLPGWVAVFPELAEVTDHAWLECAARAKDVVLPQGHHVFREGDPCRHYILVIDGTTRVYKGFESGREMVLYRLHRGETCSLTTSVLLAGGPYPASAVTEAETHAVLIPSRDFHATFDKSQGFRRYVCAVFGGRVRDLIMLLESVTLRHVDVRLARWMLDHADARGQVVASHRELAFELGTAREVVSRHLKDFEGRGWVRLARRRIEIVDPKALRELVGGCRA